MRLPLILFCCLLFVPAALATPNATGDGVLELKAVNASRVVIGTRGQSGVRSTRARSASSITSSMTTWFRSSAGRMW